MSNTQPDNPSTADDSGNLAYRERCPLCGGTSHVVGHRLGLATRRQHTFRLCDECQFGFVADPGLDFDQIYDEAYYGGRGADPLVDYLAEARSPETNVRQHEWEGVTRIAKDLVPPDPARRWLDYGCGNGLLVRHVQSLGLYDCYGYEVSMIGRLAAETGARLLSEAELSAAEGTFDLITALEVIEHLVDPVSEFRRMFRLLKPGGVLFYTTGNTTRFRKRLATWSYARPDIHVSYFDPSNAALALRKAGFMPEPMGYRPGARGVITFKVLKGLGQRQRKWWHRLIPWPVLCPLLDRYYGVMAMPLGRKPAAGVA